MRLSKDLLPNAKIQHRNTRSSSITMTVFAGIFTKIRAATGISTPAGLSSIVMDAFFPYRLA